MTTHDGRNVLLKAGDGASPSETFTTIGGLLTTRLVIDNVLLDASNLASGAWRGLHAATGQQAMTLSGTGAFTDSAAEEFLRGHAFANAIQNYEVHFGNGDVVRGAFQITHYERTGNIGEEARYALTLESAGAITVILS